MIENHELPIYDLGQSSMNSKPAKGSDSLKGKRSRRRGNDWKIMEGLKEFQKCEVKPDMFEGYMMKRRKWPLKGWHKRLFVLDQGILTYAKTPSEIARGKIYGSVDVGLSVISTKPSRRRIDIDAEGMYISLAPNLKFDEWVSHLYHHRLYRQHEVEYGSRHAPRITSPIDDFLVNFTPDSTVFRKKPFLRDNSLPNATPALLGRQATPHGRVAAWILDTNSLEQCNKGFRKSREYILASIQQGIFHLGTILEKLECLSMPSSENIDIGELTNLKKERKKYWLKKNKKKNRSSEIIKRNFIDPCEQPMAASSEDITSSVVNNQVTSESKLILKDMSKLSTSNPLLQTATSDSGNINQTSDENTHSHQPFPIPSINIQDGGQQLNNEFVGAAKEVHSSLRGMVRMIQTERDRLKQALEKEISSTNNVMSPPHSHVASLKASLNQTLQQNTELRARLSRIHADSDLGEIVTTVTTPPTPVQQNSLTSTTHECNSVLSASDYYDATENFSASETSSEGTLSEDDYEEESAISELSDLESDYHSKQNSGKDESSPSVNCNTGRRSKLPAAKPDSGDFSLWNLLCKNIGKDLSKVSMPVTLNEPLNVLQRLCEELEYSDLLDKASAIDDASERMMYVAAFAVSAYSSTYYRAGHKPFNPLLGETFECIREDRGFKFISEQVSHHPPISACYAESENFQFWQDIRIKTKFWGKSMEIQPLGTVHVVLPRTGAHYKWNKVTSCVHNIFSGQRWADQYGEMKISSSDGSIHCKLTFVKASYWSNKRHEVHGNISSTVDGYTNVTHTLFGKWNEALYCGVPPSARCIWRPGAMPEDYELYYGFSRFALELNELTPETMKILPPTDTRLRPDQRMLEEGDVNGAEPSKLQLEQSQRERRKRREALNLEYEPMWFKKLEDPNRWEFNHQYWIKRHNPGFNRVTFPQALW
ncbi:Oxysterol-binding protein-related protein 6 [Nymphon striatum]|nr:Oxysterol-binding protein-related protein 6 [Nymphon striatum]